MAKRPYKPTKLRALEGGRSNSLKKPGKVLEKEPQPRPVAPKCSPDIDTQAKKVWKDLAPKLERIGLLTETDGDMFAILCQIRSRLVFIIKRIKTIDKGLPRLEKELFGVVGDSKEVLAQKADLYQTITSMRGEKVFLMKEERLYSANFKSYAGEFGLSPRSRVGLVIGADSEGDGEDLLT